MTVRARALLALAVALILGASPAMAALQDDLDEIGGQISDLQAAIDAAESAETDLTSRIAATAVRMEALVADLEAAEADLVSVADKIADREANLLGIQDDLQAHYQALDDTTRVAAATKERAEAQVVALYMSGGVEGADLVFSVSDVLEASLSLEYAARATEHTEQIGQQLAALRLEQQRQAQAVAEAEAQVEGEVAQLRTFREQLQNLADQVAERKSRVEAELSVQKTLLATVSAEIDHFESELESLEREQERVETLIQQAQDTSGDAPGILLRPVSGRVTSPYGPRVHPILGTTRLHTGMDFGSGYGTPIAAAAAGTVIHASGFGGYGNTVIIDHGGGMSTLYAHQSEINVSDGGSVETGDTIGFVGSTGLSTGPHLHFEVRILGSPVDPAPYFYMDRKVVATNRKARHDFDVIDTIEAGIQLVGSEVKSLRAGSVQIKDGFVLIRDGEAWLENVHIAPYQFSRDGGHEPERRRKLLMKRREIDRIAGTIAEKGLTLVPLSIYFAKGLAKVELGLVKGRRNYDKRQAIRQREEKREMDRAARRSRR